MKWILRLLFRQLRKNLDVDITLEKMILTVVVIFSGEIVFSKKINLKDQINV